MKRNYVNTILSYIPFEDIKKASLINSKWNKSVEMITRCNVLTGKEWNERSIVFNYLDHLTFVKNREPLAMYPNKHVSFLKFYALSLYGITELQTIVFVQNIIHLELIFIDSLGPIWLHQLKQFVNLEYLKITSFQQEQDYSDIKFLNKIKVFKTRSKGGNVLKSMKYLKELEIKDDDFVQYCYNLKRLTLHLDPFKIVDRYYSFDMLKKLKSLKRLVIKDDLFERGYFMFDLNQLDSLSSHVKIIMELKHVVIPFNYILWHDFQNIIFIIKKESSSVLLNNYESYTENKHIFIEKQEISKCDEKSINSLLQMIESTNIKLLDCDLNFNWINFELFSTVTSLWIKRMSSCNLEILKGMKQLKTLRLEGIASIKNKKYLAHNTFIEDLVIINCRGIYLQTVVAMKQLVNLEYDQRDLTSKGLFGKWFGKRNPKCKNEFMKHYNELKKIPNCVYNSIQMNFTHPSITDKFYYFTHSN